MDARTVFLIVLAVLVILFGINIVVHWIRFRFIESKKKPQPDDILKSIRERLLPFDFTESYDSQYHGSTFSRNHLSVIWSNNMHHEHFIFSLKDQDRGVVTMNSPWYIEINEKDWREFSEQVIQKLDDWLKAI